jgi:hypothetical protein
MKPRKLSRFPHPKFAHFACFNSNFIDDFHSQVTCRRQVVESSHSATFRSHFPPKSVLSPRPKHFHIFLSHSPPSRREIFTERRRGRNGAESKKSISDGKRDGFSESRKVLTASHAKKCSVASCESDASCLSSFNRVQVPVVRISVT